VTSCVTAIAGHRARHGGYLTDVACPAAKVPDLDLERAAHSCTVMPRAGTETAAS
jgi:hypothetical protein